MMSNESLVVKYSGLNVGSLEQAYGRVISSNRTMKDRVNELMALGLLEDVLIDERPYRALQLTERGREVAEHVAAIERAVVLGIWEGYSRILRRNNRANETRPVPDILVEEMVNILREEAEKEDSRI